MTFHVKEWITNVPPPWDRFIRSDAGIVVEVSQGLKLERSQWMEGTSIRFSIRGPNLPETVEEEGISYRLEILEHENGHQEGVHRMMLSKEGVRHLDVPGHTHAIRVRAASPDIRSRREEGKTWTDHHWQLGQGYVPVPESGVVSFPVVGKMFGPQIELTKQEDTSQIGSPLEIHPTSYRSIIDDESRVALSLLLRDDGLVIDLPEYDGTHPLLQALGNLHFGTSPHHPLED